MLRRAGCVGFAFALAFGVGGAGAQDKVRISFNPLIYSYLPVLLAMDKGYFGEQKIEIEVTTYGGSAISQLPLLARGDQDIAGMVTGPGFFNQHVEGFGIKLIASIAQPKQGWHDTNWLMVRKDLWESGAIKVLGDLKGRVVEGGPVGSPVYLNTTEAIKRAGLSLKEVTLTERTRAVTDVMPLFRNKAADVSSSVEPIAGRLEAEGIAVRWKPSWEVMPWFQESYFAANPKFLAEKRDVTKRFLLAFVKAAKEVTSGEGKWTADMIASVRKWSKLPEDAIRAIPGPQFVGQLGHINRDSIARQQRIWMDLGLVKEGRPIEELVDASIIDEIRSEQGLRQE